MAVMNSQTRQRWLNYLSTQAQLHGAQREGTYLEFNVDPAVQQRMEKARMDSDPFLSKVGSYGVTDQEGEKVSLGVSGPVASVHKSTTERRQPRDISRLSADRYRCERVNYDTYISFVKLDAWNGQRNFQTLLSQQIIQQEANDRLMIGFNGTHHHDPSDPARYPMLEDVNTGWLQHIRSKAPAQVMSDVTLSHFDDDGKRLARGMYNNLDAVVYDATTSLLAPWHQNAKDLVVITGRRLTTFEDFRIINEYQPHAPNTERLAGNELLKLNALNGIPVYPVPFFPDGTLLITTFKNLSVYWQKGRYARRLQIEPEYNRIATYADNVEGYVVEDYGLCCLIEGIHHAGEEKEEAEENPPQPHPDDSTDGGEA